ASNVLGYPGFPYATSPPDGTIPADIVKYNVDWCNQTLRSTRLNVFVCPSDPYNTNSNNFFNNPSDLQFNITPVDLRTNTPLMNWSRGNYGAVQGATDADHTVNFDPGSRSNPFPGMPKHGMMPVNYNVSLAAVTDGTSNTAMIAEMRAGLNSL